MTENPAGATTVTVLVDSEQPERTMDEYERFVSLTTRIVSVPKSEIESAGDS